MGYPCHRHERALRRRHRTARARAGLAETDASVARAASLHCAMTLQDALHCRTAIARKQLPAPRSRQTVYSATLEVHYAATCID